MSVTISPVGLAAAPVANELSILATYRERLCNSYCVDSSLQPQTTVTYTHGAARLVDSTVFIPIQAVISVVTQNPCSCTARTHLFTENFVVAFQGQTAVPTAINIAQEGRDIKPACVRCGCAHGVAVNDSLRITITPPATPAA